MNTPADRIESPVEDRRWLALAVLCLSLVLIVLDNTVLNVALPTLVRELGATTTQLQWMVDAYVIVFAGLLLTAGALGDRFGRRRSLQAGLMVFALASGLAALSSTSDQLIGARAVMGLGAAFVMPATLSIIISLFTDPKERARAIAIWAGMAGVGVALGPVVGGWLLEHFWWGSVFLINLPIVALALVSGRLLLPESSDPSHARLDVTGAVLSIAGIGALLWAIIEAPVKGWDDPLTIAAFVVAAVLVGGFVWWERRVEHPMLDVGFFADPRFSAASASIALVFFALFGSFFLFTQLLQFVLGYSALEAGLRLLPISLVMGIVSPVSARLVERAGTKVVVTTGLVIAAVGLAMASTLSVASGYGPLLAAMLVLSLGISLTMAPATESVMGSLPPAKAGVGSAVNDTTRELGGALGVAVLGSLLASGYASTLGDSLRNVPVPAEAVGVARESLGAALQVAGTVGGEVGDVVALAARTAFVDAMGTGTMVAAGVALVGAVVAAVFLPGRERGMEAPVLVVDEDDVMVDVRTAAAESPA
jgi:EmrB/QacA subfamily drug resistance transporter